MADGVDLDKHPERWTDLEVVSFYKKLIKEGWRDGDQQKKTAGLLLQSLHLQRLLVRNMVRERA